MIILFLDSDFTIFLLMVPPKILIAYINLSRSSVVDYNDNNNIKSTAQVLSDIRRFYSFSIALLIVCPDGFVFRYVGRRDRIEKESVVGFDLIARGNR